MSRTSSDQPMLITTADESPDDELARRRRKYGIMMSMRAVCVLAAALTYQVSIYLAVAFIAGGVVLPWCAVLIANDRPAKKRPRVVYQPTVNTERALMAGDDGRTIDL